MGMSSQNVNGTLLNASTTTMDGKLNGSIGPVLPFHHGADRGTVFDRVRLAQILAGAEGAAGAGDHQHPRGVILGDIVQGIADLAQHVAGEAVELLRTVQGQAPDRAGAIEQDTGFGHMGCAV